MKRVLPLIVLISLALVIDAGAQTAGYVDCYGGSDADGQFWFLLDHEGQPLEDGDWVYAAWAGPDGTIDPPDDRGYPTGDDVKLPVASERIEYHSFLLVVATWERGYRDEEGQERQPMDGELIYCRIFDDPRESIGPRTHYSDSQLHAVEWKMGDVFFCRFPGDPGGGRAATPLPSGSASGTAPPAGHPAAAELRQVSPHLQHPAVELEYALPIDGPVSLRIYDRWGHQAAVLVDDEQKAGRYSIRWDGGVQPAGIYIAVLRAGEEKILKPIVLLR